MNSSNDNHSTNSHVESRIPNLIGFKRRKIIGKPKEENIFPSDCSLEKCKDHSDFLNLDVCLRIKPKTNNYSTKQNTLTILSDNTVACSNGNTRDGVTEYTFSSVFGPNIDQKTFFNSWVYDKVLRFLNGNSELLFAYGTTNAGKTYTIHGNLNDPGIIPRTLSLIFSTLNNKLMSQCKYKPVKVNTAHILDDNLMRAEEDTRNTILNNWSTEKIKDELESLQGLKGQKIYSVDQLANKSIAKMFDGIKNYKKAFLDHGDVLYTVWVSYAEVYNESIYDLLISYSVNQKRIPLKLSLDKHKDAYVRDLTHVFVKSAEEAYKIMSFGRNNLKIASNNLNKLSNRSHCIFTIKLMRVENKENPETAVISSITFCDLAGSERLKKTMNVGDRLIESKNINTSLLVLNKCFSVLRENQKRGENHVVPFRESKLTQMFQAAFIGNTRSGISMTINVDMSFGLLDETKQVLFMSAIVHSISKNKGKKKSKSRPSFTVWSLKNRKPIPKSKYKQNLFNGVDENFHESKIEEKLMITKKKFEIKLEEEQVKLRKELISQFQTILSNNNTFHKNQKETMIKKKTKMYEDKIEQIRGYHLEEIQEIKNNLQSESELTIQHVTSKYTNQIENYKFCIDELEMQKQELLAEIYILKNMQDIRQHNIYSKNQENETLLKEANTEHKHLEADINEMTIKYDESYQELEEKNLEVARFVDILEIKDNIIPKIKNHQDELITEGVEQKLLQHFNEKLEVNVGLENTTQVLKNEEEKSEMAKQYQIMNQKYLNMSKTQNSNDSLLNSKLTGTTDMCGKSLDEVIVKIPTNIHK